MGNVHIFLFVYVCFFLCFVFVSFTFLKKRNAIATLLLFVAYFFVRVFSGLRHGCYKHLPAFFSQCLQNADRYKCTQQKHTHTHMTHSDTEHTKNLLRIM